MKERQRRLRKHDLMCRIAESGKSPKFIAINGAREKGLDVIVDFIIRHRPFNIGIIVRLTGSTCCNEIEPFVTHCREQQ